VVPFNSVILSFIPTSLIGLFFSIWAPNLLKVARYSTAVSLPGCDANCTAFALPGGLEMTRRVNHSLNHTALEDDIFGGVEAIQITNAPGYLIRFESHSGVNSFDVSNDCSIYGKHMNESIQLCIRSDNSSLIVGKIEIFWVSTGYLA
jgi:hypothetical protein